MSAPKSLIDALVNAWLDADTAAAKAIAVRESLEKAICDQVDPRRIGDRTTYRGREVIIERRELILQGARPELRIPSVMMYGMLDGKEVYLVPPKV